MRTAALLTLALVLSPTALPQAQGTTPATPITLITRDGRRPVPTTVLNGQEYIALNDLAALFQLAVREDALAGGITVTYKGRTIVASADQPMASVSGRVVTMPAPVLRLGGRLLAPVDFIQRALAPIYDSPIDFRRAARMIVVGAIRVARVVVRIDAAGPPTRATVEVTPALLVSSSLDAGRALVRIEADVLDVAPPPPGAGLIDQIIAGNQTTTVAFALNARAGTPRVTTATTTESTRVSIEVPLSPQSQDTSAAPPAPPGAPPVVAPPIVTPPAEGLPPIATVRTARLQTMVIDAGHGGADGGVKGPKGTLEKQVALDVARRLKTLVETRLGVRVVMTREDDRAVSPDERDAIANNSKADLFVSLHLNGAPSPGVRGAEVYVLRLDRAGEEARRTTEASELVLPALGGLTRPIDVIPWDLAQAAHVDDSSRFASMLEEELEKHAPMGPRPLQPSPMRVLSGANMPAALVEMAYLTNADQEQRVQSAEFQGGIAQAVYDAIVRFRAYLEADR